MKTEWNICNFTQMVAIISICLFVLLASEIGHTQENKPITKENLIAALKNCKSRRYCSRCRQCKLRASDFIQRIKQLKVDFRLTELGEQEIREAGSFFGERDLNKLIFEVHSAYRSYAPSILPSGGLRRNFNYMDLRNGQLSDSCGDSAIDEKVRLVHTSINNTLHLDTNYKFYDDVISNIFVVAHADKNYLDGTLFIEINFIKKILASDLNNSSLAKDSLLYFLIAHELSHLKQLKIELTFSGYKSKQIELHADFLAGWWVARFLRTTNNNSPEYQDAFFKVISLAFRMGDTDPIEGHHGTPKERLDAVSAGFGLQNETDPDKVYEKGIYYVSHL
jgi:hypothetical protein